MTNKIFQSKDFDFKSNQSFFFDNNIWMFLYCPIAQYNEAKQNVASTLFEKILSRNGSIIVNSLIVSEFSNAYLRLDFNLWKEETKNPLANFKNDYFSTKRAIDTRSDIANTVNNKILKIAEKHPDSFNALNFNNIFSAYKVLDYNDAIIYNECINKNWILVSDDSDFTKFDDLTIIRI
ncbi:PIN domain-containing protein [Flavobacterium sp. HXWNR29]|uniref:PIN domain-containing protein n=1 Tax=Flavobacterium odoriferum TaxID=2946604 RepID=UPI0021CB02D8|nr:PIN domain-containing protein [Flavobacterium sp. HXWNR29]MCU4190205.1 PIN domain-containing protein [Flavobacterium sp. HXWNR29]